MVNEWHETTAAVILEEDPEYLNGAGRQTNIGLAVIVVTKEVSQFLWCGYWNL